MNYYSQQIIYDCTGTKIKTKFILLECGHIFNQSQLLLSLCGLDRSSHKYYFKCIECNKSVWVDSFGCLGCFVSSSKPTICDHRKDQPTCIGLRRDLHPCKYKSKINNGGYCNIHNNEKMRIKQANIILNSLPNYCYMIDDILNTILSFIIEKNK
jgi:hypothetical protein